MYTNTISQRQEYDYYYYRRDHLGSNVAVWDATADSTVQRTLYYASGLPMRESKGQEVQTRKYNGKEYHEIYGLNEYDYGFRGYYATIGRFTAKDPLGELTPWQSPYGYAKNNSILNIDYKGLMYVNHRNGYSWLSLDDRESIRSYTEFDMDGVVTKHIDDENDKRVILVHDDGTKHEIGTELDNEKYRVGHRAYYRSYSSGVKMVYSFRRYISVTPKTELDVRIERWLRAKNVDKIEDQLLEKERPIIQGIVLTFPILSQYNDAKTLITGSNIYGTPADATDYWLSAISLGSGGISSMLSEGVTKSVLKITENVATGASGIKTTRDEYKNK